MAGYYVFFRCWPGFTEPFPFDRFNALPDDKVVDALDSFAHEQLRLPEICERIKPKLEHRKKERAKWGEKLKEQSKRRTGGPAPVTLALSPHKSFRQMRWERVRHASRKDLLVCRLGAYLGWWHSEILGLSGPVVPRIWFCEARSGEFAEQLVAELMNAQSRLIKLTTLAKRDFDTHELEYHANPRYGFISAEGLSDGQRASIRRCIQAIQEGREPDVEYGSLVLPIGKWALAVALDLAKAWPVEEDKELTAELPAPLPAASLAMPEQRQVEAPLAEATPPAQPRAKRSTERGEGRAKLIAALTKHHKYADGSCLNLDPIGNNELARLAGVSESTASAFFNKEFDGHTKYRAVCTDATRLVGSLKLLNQEFSPHHLYGGKPPGEDERDDEE